MNDVDWAMREVDRACDILSEKYNYPGHDIARYRVALQGFIALCIANYADYSERDIFEIKRILNRLIDRKVLSPIKDTKDAWELVAKCKNGSEFVYRCVRMPDLYKKVYSDGNIMYIDQSRVVCIDKTYENGSLYTLDLATTIAHKMFPIKMPYYPLDGPIIVTTENHDFAIHVRHIKVPGKKPILVNRYFRVRKSGDSLGDFDLGNWIEICCDEYLELIGDEKCQT